MNILNILSVSKKLSQLLLTTPAPEIALLALPDSDTLHQAPDTIPHVDALLTLPSADTT